MPRRPSPGNLADPYGWRIHPLTNRRTFHDGEDIGWAKGLQIYAPADATVIAYGPAGGYGNRLELRLGDVDIWLCHLAASSVRVGQRVTEGQPIATMGATGNVTGVHLHWEVRIGGKRVDPVSWLTSPTQGGSSNITPIRKRQPMNYFLAVDDTGRITLNGAKAIRNGYTYVQGADGVIRPVGKQESGALTFFGHQIAQWPASVIESLAIGGGYAEHSWEHVEPRHTGRVLIGSGLTMVRGASSVALTVADRAGIAEAVAGLVKLPSKLTGTLS